MAIAWILVVLLAVLAPLVVLSLLGARRRRPDDVSIKKSLCGLLNNVIWRSQGCLPNGWRTKNEERARIPVPKELKDSLSAIQKEFSVDSQNYSKYCQLCDFVDHLKAEKSREPHCYMESAFFGLFIKIISSPDFPVSPLGLIHLRQTMIIYSSLQLEKSPRFTLEAHVSEVRVVEKGIEIDITASVSLLPGRTLVWEGVTTILSRNKATQSRTRRGPKQGQTPRNEDESQYTGLSSFNVPVDIGWQFAGVCGDYSPHHLNQATAKMIGYNKPMAHGMWTLSRSLSSILNDEDCQFSSCYPLQIVVNFKRPLFLPATAEVHYCVVEEKGSKVIQLKVTTEKNKSLNLEASVVCNATDVSR